MSSIIDVKELSTNIQSLKLKNSMDNSKSFNSKEIEKHLQQLTEFNERIITEFEVEGKNKNDQEDGEKLSILHLAAIYDKPDVIKLIISKCIDIDINFRGLISEYSPLHIAAAKNNLEIIDMLLDKDALLETVDSGNHTPLMYAVHNGCIDAIAKLIQRGANLYAKGEDGENLLDIAIENKNYKCIEVLLDSGFDLAEAYPDEKLKELIDNAEQNIKPILLQYTPIILDTPDTSNNLEKLSTSNIEELEKFKLDFYQEAIQPTGLFLSKESVKFINLINDQIKIKKYPEEINREPIFDKIGKPINTCNADMYVYLDKSFIALPNGSTRAEIINKLITILLYKAQRNKWDSPVCIHLIKLITHIDEKLNFHDKEKFNKLINFREELAQDFFGEELSDDSDSEIDNNTVFDSKEHQNCEIITKTIGIDKIKKGLKEISLQKAKEALKEDGKGKRDRSDKLLSDKKFNKRVIIPHNSDEIKKIKNDLTVLNRHIINGKPIDEAIKKVDTKFFVAQYRGLTYLTSRWNTSSRRAHRKSSEVNLPQYGASVYSLVEFNIFKEYNETRHKSTEMQNLLDIEGKKLRSMLLEMRKTDDYKETSSKFTYDNLAEYVQDKYSTNYQDFHQAIADGGELSSYKDKYFLNEQNPFVSTGDRPYHALRYAYGIKPYKGKESERLRPRWKKKGQAERPYSGKVYLSLHPLTDYGTNGPMHLMTLTRQGKSKLSNIILPERETTFPAYIEKDRVLIEHIAKYPSFSFNYHPKYLIKYGLDEELYSAFKDVFKKYPPHSYERRYAKQILGNWLCAYHERLLLLKADSKAKELHGVLIYKDDDGTFSLNLPSFKMINANGEENKEIKAEIMLCREYRKK